MRISFNYSNLREDLNRLEILSMGQIAFVFSALFFEFFYGLSFTSWLLATIGMGIFYRLYYLIKRELYYSFWSFSFLLIIFLLNKIIFNNFEASEIKLLYLIGLILLSLEMYILSSPIYYPRVSWWEYDFRFRADLNVLLILDSEDKTEARITDLRRNAGCIASFKDLPIGSEFKIESSKYFEDELTLEIVSKRIYSLGRPFNYGVKFILNDESKESSYKNLLMNWKNEALEIREKKFIKKHG